MDIALLLLVGMLLMSIIFLRYVDALYNANVCYMSVAVITLEASTLVFVVFLGYVLETISIGFRSISLGFRMCANLSAGHVLQHILQGVVLIATSITLILMNVVLISLAAYELAVVVIQAMVYCSLLYVYLGI